MPEPLSQKADSGSVRDRLDQVFRKTFANPSLAVRDDMQACDVDGWDSLSHINLIYSIEKEFRIRFTTAEIAGLKNAGELVRLVERKTGAA
jgi:acyl carrier protein